MNTFHKIANLIWPKRCPACKCGVHPEAVFCPPCSATLIPPEATCLQCGQQLGLPTKQCDRCRQQRYPVKSCRWAFEHGAAAQKAVHELKYKNGVWIAASIATFFEPTSVYSAVNWVVPVPLSSQRLRKRHYNQAGLIARHVAEFLDVPVSYNSIVKHRHTVPQVGLSATQRQTNVKDAFSCPGPLRGKHVLLIDDVSTPGATLQACARKLRRAGALSVDAWTFTHDG